jgi:hypothetical protein
MEAREQLDKFKIQLEQQFLGKEENFEMEIQNLRAQND